MEMKEVKIRLYDWQIEALKKRGLKVSEVARDLVSMYLRGDLDEVINQISVLNELYELRDKLNVLSEEYSRILNQLPNLPPIKDSPISIRAYDDKVVQTILDVFEDVNYSPSKLTNMVYDVQRAVMIRLYTVVPAKLGHPVSREYIDYLIQTDDRLSFLRPFIISSSA